MATEVPPAQPRALPGGPRGWAPTLTTIASDVSRGRLLLDACIRPLRPLYGGKRLFGPALTAWCEPAISAQRFMRSRSRVRRRDRHRCQWCLSRRIEGEHLCGSARRKGVTGMIVNGAVREPARCRPGRASRSLPR